MKRDLRKAEEEEKWREKVNNRDQWKHITKVAVLRSDQKTSLIPIQGNQRKNNIVSLKLNFKNYFLIICVCIPFHTFVFLTT